MEVKEDFHVVDANQHISITLRYDLLKLPHQPYELLLSIHVVLHNLLTSAPLNLPPGSTFSSGFPNSNNMTKATRSEGEGSDSGVQPAEEKGEAVSGPTDPILLVGCSIIRRGARKVKEEGEP